MKQFIIGTNFGTELKYYLECDCFVVGSLPTTHIVIKSYTEQ